MLPTAPRTAHHVLGASTTPTAKSIRAHRYLLAQHWILEHRATLHTLIAAAVMVCKPRSHSLAISTASVHDVHAQKLLEPDGRVVDTETAARHRVMPSLDSCASWSRPYASRRRLRCARKHDIIISAVRIPVQCSAQPSHVVGGTEVAGHR